MKLDHSSLEADTGWSEIELEKMGVLGVERILIGTTTGPMAMHDTGTLGVLIGMDQDPELEALYAMSSAGVYQRRGRRAPSRKDSLLASRIARRVRG